MRRIGGSVCVRNVKGVLALIVGFVRRVSRVVYVVRIRVEYKTELFYKSWDDSVY